MTIIALVGLTGSGKDTIADHLLNKEKSLGYEHALKFAFATHVKSIVRKEFRLAEYLDGSEPERIVEDKDAPILNGYSYRDICKSIAEAYKKIDPDIWINKLRIDIQDALIGLGSYEDDRNLFVVTDCRFNDEYEYLKELGAIVIDVSRSDMYVKEKAIVGILGINWFSRAIVWCMNRKIADGSEWNYFSLRDKADYHLDNTDLEEGQGNAIAIVDEIKRIEEG